MDVCDDGVFHLARDFKTPKFIRCFRPSYLLVPDKSSKTCIADGGAESLQFRRIALDDQLDAAIGQIAYLAADLEAGGDGLGGVAEADALHATGVVDGQAAAGTGIWAWRHGRIKPKVRARRKCFFAPGYFFCRWKKPAAQKIIKTRLRIHAEKIFKKVAKIFAFCLTRAKICNNKSACHHTIRLPVA
jgi:hypothetical protein